MNDTAYLAHHGTKGMKWGNRKYQNADGSLTSLGRIHYGVGQAREAVRKKIKPTNAELNAQIRKQKSKNLNKQKRQELRDLKKGITKDAQSPSSKKATGQHKKFSEMSDEDIQKRINRLKSEVTLAELEATKSMGPGTRFVYEAVKQGGKQGISNLVSNAITKKGEYQVSKWINEATKSDAAKAAKKDNNSQESADAIKRRNEVMISNEKAMQESLKTQRMIQEAADRSRGIEPEKKKKKDN